ncbi:MAG: MAPEG family protein [Rhodospirillales bacterium]
MSTQIALSTDLRMLAYAAFVSIVVWIPYIAAGIRTFGLRRMAGIYPTPDYVGLPQWAQRLHRAHLNLVENLAPFAVLVIAAHVTGTAGEMTALGARLFFWSRLLQIALHAGGVPWGRTVTFTVGWIGNLIIFYQVVA